MYKGKEVEIASGDPQGIQFVWPVEFEGWGNERKI